MRSIFMRYGGLGGGLLALLSCAKVGDPLPPLVLIPDPVKQLEIRQEGDLDPALRLVFPAPADSFADVLVFRACGAELAVEQDVKRYLVVPAGRLEVLSDGRMAVLDPTPGAGEKCLYSVRIRNRQGRLSEESNREAIEYAPGPDPPSDLSWQVRENEVELNWNPPHQSSAIAGYLLNQSTFVAKPSYVLREFEFGVPLSFFIQTVRSRERPVVVSRPLGPVSFTPADTFPPQPPLGLRVISTQSGFQLIWEPGPETDLESYRVYRSTGIEGTTRRLAENVAVSRYFHRLNEGEGGPVAFFVTAVDRWGNESGPSAKVEAAPVQ